MDTTILNPFFKSIPIVAFLGVIVLSAATSPPAINDPYTGHYYVHGSKIVSTGGWFGSDYTVLDTINFSSVVTVKLMTEMTDTLHFFGLPGADEGDNRIYNGRTQFSDYIGGIVMYNDFDYYKVYGSLSGDNFEIRYTRPGGHYNATGNISNSTIEFQGEYLYRGTKVEYNLVGEKINRMQ